MGRANCPVRKSGARGGAPPKQMASVASKQPETRSGCGCLRVRPRLRVSIKPGESAQPRGARTASRKEQRSAVRDHDGFWLPCSPQLRPPLCRLVSGRGAEPRQNKWLPWRANNLRREADAVASGFGQDSGFPSNPEDRRNPEMLLSLREKSSNPPFGTTMVFRCHARSCSARLCAGSCRGSGRSPAKTNGFRGEQTT